MCSFPFALEAGAVRAGGKGRALLLLAPRRAQGRRIVRTTRRCRATALLLVSLPSQPLHRRPTAGGAPELYRPACTQKKLKTGHLEGRAAARAHARRECRGWRPPVCSSRDSDVSRSRHAELWRPRPPSTVALRARPGPCTDLALHLARSCCGRSAVEVASGRAKWKQRCGVGRRRRRLARRHCAVVGRARSDANRDRSRVIQSGEGTTS